MNQFKLLPPSKETCPICATKHDPHDPHNARSMYYLYRFYGVRGRWPTWADVMAHCDDETKSLWKQALIDRCEWSEPDDGQPIADPPSESVNQIVEMEKFSPVTVMKLPTN